MRNRMAILAGPVTVGVLITGIAFAAQDVDESTVNVSLGESQTLTLPVDDAGVIVLNRANGQLRIVSATPNTGYTAEVEVAVGREVEADFRGNGLRVRFNGELEDGVVRVRIRTEADDSTGVTSLPGSTSVTGLTSQTSTSPTIPTSSSAAGISSGNLVLAEGQVGRVSVADAGSVLLRRSGGSLNIVSTESNPGWVVEVEVATGRQVEGDFRSGSRRVKFNFELEDGVVRLRIESEGSSSVGSPTTSTTVGSGSSPATTNTTGVTRGESTLPTGSVTYNLGGAGTVSVNFANGGMTIGSINPAGGWTIQDSEQKSDEIEVELTNGDAEAELRVKINNGGLEVEIDNENS